MRRELLWLVLAIVGCACYFQSRGGADFRLRLSLAPRLDSPEAFQIQLDQAPGAPMHYRLSGPGMKLEEGELAVDQGELLQDEFSEAGLFTLPDGDSKQPENQVFYTVCEAHRGKVTHISRWRGLPVEHARVARLFYESPHFSGWTQRAVEWCGRQKSGSE